MVKVEDPSILEESAKDEYKDPLPQKIGPDGRTIYLSRNNYGPTLKTTGIITITDFDLSLWDLLEGKKLFKDVDPLRDQEYNEPNHLAYITSLLGPPPEDILARGRRAGLFYTADGTLRIEARVPATFKFENLIRNIHGDDKRMFIEFVSKMIKWRPEERSTAKELLEDPWLYADFDDD
ncbi:hypothetical protein AFLA70_209g002181 [Aspergillus flavus AF70]|nr:hypothetical protein AFLA70_209g002181 [Aspergillus flavus AF70]